MGDPPVAGRSVRITHSRASTRPPALLSFASAILALFAIGGCRRAKERSPLPERRVEVRLVPRAGGYGVVAIGRLVAKMPPFDLTLPPCKARRRFDVRLEDLRTLDAGALRVDGFGEPLILDPTGGGYRQQPASYLRTISARPGAEISASASGGPEIAAFQLAARLPAAPALGPMPVTARPGDPLTVRWHPGHGDGIEVALNERAQGKWVLLAICEGTEESGQLTIPGAITRSLVPGSATLTVARESLAEQSVGGQPIGLELLVEDPAITLPVEGGG